MSWSREVHGALVASRRVVKAQRVVWLSSVPEAAPAPAAARPTPEPASEEEVRGQAERLLEEARHEAQRLREEAHRQGWEEGWAQGHGEGLRQAAQEAAELIRQAHQEVQELYRRAAQDLGLLACEMASRLLGVAVSLDPELVAREVEALLEETRPLGVWEVDVHPSDLALARQARDRWLARLGGEADIAVVPDPDLPPASVRVRTQGGDVEAVWPERLADMEQALEEVAARYGPDA
jgi:flagellar assembly protein FliH